MNEIGFIRYEFLSVPAKIPLIPVRRDQKGFYKYTGKGQNNQDNQLIGKTGQT